MNVMERDQGEAKLHYLDGEYDVITPADASAFKDIAGGAPTNQAFVSPITDFYLTNPIARASKTMAECSSLANQRRAVGM